MEKQGIYKMLDQQSRKVTTNMFINSINSLILDVNCLCWI